MKNLFYAVTALFFLLFGITTNAQPDKYALIVAIGDYPAEGKWGDISSQNDVPLIEAALKAQGFEEKDIKVIYDDEATRAGMEEAIKEYLLKPADDGDVVFFHYSGHGQQIADNDGDEYDGYDEALVPYDAHMFFKSGVYEGENHFRDDDLGDLFYQVLQKIGEEGNFLVVLDACHSGTATRGINDKVKARGSDHKMQPPNYQPSQKEGQAQNDGTFGIDKDTKSRGNEQVGTMVVLSGASADELNYETLDDDGNGVGSLTYAFSRSMAKAGKNTSYRNLFDRIKIDMSSYAPRQTPQCEGDVDIEIFGGNAVDVKPYFLVSKVYDPKTFLVPAGNLLGLFDNTEVGIYDIAVNDPSGATPKAKGKIVNASLLESDVLMDTELTEEEIKNSRVFITNQSYGTMTVDVSLDLGNARGFEEKLRDDLSASAIINLVEDNPQLLIELNNPYTRGNNVQITTFSDAVIYEQPYSDAKADELAREILDRVKGFAQAEYLKKLEMTDLSKNVSFNIVPVSVNKVGRNISIDEKLDIDDFKTPGNTYEFEFDQHFVFEVTNNGSKTVYFTIVDIRSNNEVDVMIPWQGKTPSDFVIKPGETISMEEAIFVFDEPAGNEMFKLIASADPLDLSAIKTTRGAGTRGDSNPFETLFAESYSGTRAAPASLPAESVNIHSIVFDVKGK